MMGDPIAELLHLGNNVGGEEDGPSIGLRLPDHAFELLLHEGIEAGGGFVQYEKLRLVHEGANDGYFLPVAVGQGANVAGKVALQPVGQPLDVGPGKAALQVGGVEEKLLAGEIGVERRVGGEVANAPSHLQGSGLGIHAEHSGRAAGGTDEVEEEADGGGLAGAIGAEIAENAAGHDLHIKIDDTPLLTVVLGELLQLDDGVHVRS